MLRAADEALLGLGSSDPGSAAYDVALFCAPGARPEFLFFPQLERDLISVENLPEGCLSAYSAAISCSFTVSALMPAANRSVSSSV